MISAYIFIIYLETQARLEMRENPCRAYTKSLQKPCSSLSTIQNIFREFSLESLVMVLISVRYVSETTLISVYACNIFVLTCEYCVGRRAYRE